jgi:hypothetical protein
MPKQNRGFLEIRNIFVLETELLGFSEIRKFFVLA